MLDTVARAIPVENAISPAVTPGPIAHHRHYRIAFRARRRAALTSDTLPPPNASAADSRPLAIWHAFAFALARHVTYRNGDHRDRRLAAGRVIAPKPCDKLHLPGDRHGKRTLRFNCFDVVIDAEAATVTLEVRELDGRRAVIPRNDLVRALHQAASRRSLGVGPGRPGAVRAGAGADDGGHVPPARERGPGRG